MLTLLFFFSFDLEKAHDKIIKLLGTEVEANYSFKLLLGPQRGLEGEVF